MPYHTYSTCSYYRVEEIPYIVRQKGGTYRIQSHKISSEEFDLESDNSTKSKPSKVMPRQLGASKFQIYDDWGMSVSGHAYMEYLRRVQEE